MASLIPRANLSLSLSRYVTSSGRKWWPVVRVLPHGGCVLVCLTFDLALGLAVVFLEAGVHGTLGLADVGGVARVGDASGARDVVDQG
jgi:hypothetical protein